MYKQSRAMAVDTIERMRKRDSLVPRYDWSACNTLRRLIITFSEMQSNLLHSIKIFNTWEMYVCHTIYHTLVLLPYYHTNLPYYLPHTHLYCYHTMRLICHTFYHTLVLLPHYQTNLTYYAPCNCTVTTLSY